jgi:Mg/Co/Ni transporter MgtE
MWKHDCDYVLIVDTEGQPIGMITDRELCVAAREQDKPLAHIAVSSVKTKTVFADQLKQSYRLGKHLNIRRHLHQVPILDDIGSLINVVTEDSLVNYIRKFRAHKT